MNNNILPMKQNSYNSDRLKYNILFTEWVEDFKNYFRMNQDGLKLFLKPYFIV